MACLTIVNAASLTYQLDLSETEHDTRVLAGT